MANLKLKKEKRKKRVDELITELGLEKCQNTLVGSVLKKGISGGERKRTAVAVELITNPSIIFMDEPTSGIDSFTALSLVQMLSRLCKEGRTIIITIHQPSSDIFRLLDRVSILVKGRNIYQVTLYR